MLFDYVIAVYCGCALVGRQQGAEDLNEGCFARSVRAKESEEFAFFDREVEVVDGVYGLGLAVEWVGVGGFEFVCFCKVDCLDGVFVVQPWTPLIFIILRVKIFVNSARGFGAIKFFCLFSGASGALVWLLQ